MHAIKSLELDRVTRRFSAATALDEFTLKVPGGAFVSLLGPSGCGKSTALNCLTGLLPLTSGAILLNGERIDHLPPEKRRFGMVFQNYALFPHLPVERNVAFGLEVMGLKRHEIKPRVDAAIKMMRLEPYLGRLPAQLSGGQQQRLAFARAVVVEPRLLLLDEPLANLDALLRDELRLEIKRLHQRLGITTINVTHDQTEAMSLSDVIVVMRAGKIEQAGTPQDIYQRPASLFVADFMGYRNRLPVAVLEADAAGVRVGAQGLDAFAKGAFKLKKGDAAVACFRPEDVEIHDEHGFEAHLSLCEFQGQGYAAEARLADGSTIRVAHDRAMAHGAKVRLLVKPDRLMVYPQ